MNKRRVVITGVGVVACNGIGKDAFWQANLEGRSGIGKITSFNTDGFDTHIGGQISDFDPSQFVAPDLVRKVDRFVHFGLACTQMAVKDSGLLDFSGLDKERIGVVIGSGLGGMMFHEEQMVAVIERSARQNPSAVPRISPNAVSSHIAIRYGFLGPNMVISTACASGNHAVGEAFRKIQWGDMDLCVTGGVEAPLTRLNFGAYCALRVVSKKNEPAQNASRPFDLERDGFVLGEGGGVIILEELNHALERNAQIYAEVTGYASNSGANHMVIPDVSGQDAARAMAGALKDAGADAASISYINAHATSTQANDRAETKAIKSVFGQKAYQIPISSTKSMIGHSLGAAGGIEAVVCALAIKNNFIPPTINLRTKDTECDLDYVPLEGRQARLVKVLSNSFGFGNCNACLVLEAFKG
ncbi:MAG: beta-ketoacyl-ACP synthase II [Candidatus Omnitrophica bacterium]|nr:beta-ketoacyl-ACP synthase II [Candidatus Omnitrophota bacterium]